MLDRIYFLTTTFNVLSIVNDHYQELAEVITNWLSIAGVAAARLFVTPLVLKQLAAIIREVKGVVRVINRSKWKMVYRL